MAIWKEVGKAVLIAVAVLVAQEPVKSLLSTSSNKPVLHAEIIAVPFVSPFALIENTFYHDHDKAVAEFDSLIERASDDRADHLGELAQKARERISTVLRAEQQDLRQLAYLRGLLIATVTNNGEQPARNAFISLPGRKLFAADIRERDSKPIWGAESVPLGDIPQGSQIDLVMWVDSEIALRWNDWERQVVLGHDSGRGEITGRRVIYGLASWLDRRVFDNVFVGMTLFIAVISVVCLAILGAVTLFGGGGASATQVKGSQPPQPTVAKGEQSSLPGIEKSEQPHSE